MTMTAALLTVALTALPPVEAPRPGTLRIKADGCYRLTARGWLRETRTTDEGPAYLERDWSGLYWRHKRERFLALDP
jgi:hypothetical protein